MPKMIIVDAKRCLGCHACEIACAVEHSESKDLLLAIHEKVLPVPRVKVIAVGEINIPMQCHHCEDAPCAAVCPTRALYRESEDAPVTFHPELCIGCSSCVLVCPFGIIHRTRDQVIKCDLCFGRLEQGQDPACITACPTKARRIGVAEDLAREKMKKAAQVMAEELKKEQAG
jgi:carbon-monoxide dehydrogenase iron sulfur subunit